MSNFILDHIFCFCEPTLVKEIKNTDNAGFTLNSGNRHPGQGTANRAILFEENYLEFIFLESLHDANNNLLKLAQRANWNKTGASPFGICLRGSISQDENNQFWEYHPPYWPGGVIFVHKSNEESPDQPFVFVIPSSARPVDRPNINPSQLLHKTKSTAILKVELAGPNYKWPHISSSQQITFTKADSPRMKVTVDGKLPNEIFLNDLLSVVSAP